MAITITSYWFHHQTTKNNQIRPKEAAQQPIYWLVWINRFCKFEIGWHYWNQWSRKTEWIYPTGATSTICWKDKRLVISGLSFTLYELWKSLEKGLARLDFGQCMYSKWGGAFWGLKVISLMKIYVVYGVCGLLFACMTIAHGCCPKSRNCFAFYIWATKNPTSNWKLYG